jgi:hypothetical protein
MFSLEISVKSLTMTQYFFLPELVVMPCVIGVGFEQAIDLVAIK